MLAVHALARLQALSVHFQVLNISSLDQLGEIDDIAIELLPGEHWELTDKLNTLFTMKDPKPSVATVAGRRTILCHIAKGIPGERWFLHPDLFFFAQYWLGPLNAGDGYRDTLYVLDRVGCELPITFSYPNEI